MGRSIIKVDRDLDLYVEWSSVVEAPIQWGPRSFMLQRGIEARRLDRADEHGSSSYYGWARWDDDGIIYQQEGILHRENFVEALSRLEKDDNADIKDLLEPFDD